MIRHYAGILEELEADDERARSVSGAEYVERIKRDLENWGTTGKAGALNRGISRFQKEAKQWTTF